MKYVVEYNDESAKATGRRHDGTTLSYAGGETLRKTEVNNVPFIYGNGSGLVKLGEILIRIGSSNYKPGFHLHIREDFDGDKSEILIFGVHGDGGTDEEPHRVSGL